MASISVYRGSDKGSGPLRFRVSDGRGVCLYWSTRLCEDKSESAIEKITGVIASAYAKLKQKETGVDSVALKREIESQMYSNTLQTGQSHVTSYRAFVEQSHNGGFIGKGRYAQCLSIASRLERWLRITEREALPVEQFTADMLLEYRKFLFDEHLYVSKYPLLYMGAHHPPRKRRKNSSVVLELKALKAFFSELEDAEELHRSPFRKLSRDRQKSIMRVMYDAPVFLRDNEWRSVRDASVPPELEWARGMFVFNCCIGSRIGDVERFGPDNLDISEDGIPYVHYVPEKTKQHMKTNAEIETPLIPIALRIMTKGLPKIRRNGYNSEFFNFVYL